MTADEEKTVRQLMSLVDGLSKLNQSVTKINDELLKQNRELLARLEAAQAIARAKA